MHLLNRQAFDPVGYSPANPRPAMGHILDHEDDCMMARYRLVN